MNNFYIFSPNIIRMDILDYKNFSKMLSVDIFVPNLHSHPRRKECHSTWYRYCSDYHKYSNPALYLANHSDYHYEPVIDLIHCRYSSFYNSYSLVMQLL